MSEPNAFDRVSPVDNATWKASWDTEDNYWHENFTSRPYAIGPDYYDRFRPAYRYGFESAQHHVGRSWDEAERDLRRGWETYQHRGQAPSVWDEIKEAVRDAWDRVVSGHNPGVQRRDAEARE
ncbi:MAG TPA: hypothetical protein VGJ36_01895 [Gemmatimonadales bacterium]|jgi:hypothetical protein